MRKTEKLVDSAQNINTSVLIKTLTGAKLFFALTSLGLEAPLETSFAISVLRALVTSFRVFVFLETPPVAGLRTSPFLTEFLATIEMGLFPRCLMVFWMPRSKI